MLSFVVDIYDGGNVMDFVGRACLALETNGSMAYCQGVQVLGQLKNAMYKKCTRYLVLLLTEDCKDCVVGCLKSYPTVGRYKTNLLDLEDNYKTPSDMIR